MSDLQRARATAKSHLTRETTHQFDVALHNAATSSLASMDELHRAVCSCVNALKNENVGPVDMILAMKSCAIDSGGRYESQFDEAAASSVETLIDQIVKWSIAEYYRNAIVE